MHFIVISVAMSNINMQLLALTPSLVVSKVDYCNSLVAAVPSHLLDRSQSVLNAAAQIIFSA